MSDKPKRPMSAYLLWLNASRDKIKADNPGLKVTEIAKKAGALWRSMDDKTEWEDKAAEAKEQYAKDLETFHANGGAPPAAAGKKGQKRGKAKQARGNKSKVKKELSDEDEDEDDDEAEDSE